MSMSYSGATGGGGGSYSFNETASFALMDDLGANAPPLSEQEQVVFDTQNSYLDQKYERQWFEDRFVSKPEFQTAPGLKYLQDLNPGYYDPEEQRIDQEAELQKNVAKILLRGPQTPEDLDIMKAIIRNKYRPKQQPLQDLYTGHKAPPIRRGPLTRIRGRETERYFNWDQNNAMFSVGFNTDGTFQHGKTFWEDFVTALDYGDQYNLP
jgi:hypothetical protein